MQGLNHMTKHTVKFECTRCNKFTSKPEGTINCLFGIKKDRYMKQKQTMIRSSQSNTGNTTKSLILTHKEWNKHKFTSQSWLEKKYYCFACIVNNKLKIPHTVADVSHIMQWHIIKKVKIHKSLAHDKLKIWENM